MWSLYSSKVQRAFLYSYEVFFLFFYSKDRTFPKCIIYLFPVQTRTVNKQWLLDSPTQKPKQNRMDRQTDWHSDGQCKHSTSYMFTSPLKQFAKSIKIEQAQMHSCLFTKHSCSNNRTVLGFVLSAFMGYSRSKKREVKISFHSSRCFFQSKKYINFFLFLHKNICCGYSLEVPQWGTSNEYPQHMFSWRNKENVYLIHLVI